MSDRIKCNKCKAESFNDGNTEIYCPICYEKQEQEIQRLKEIIDDLYDEDECEYDHHGYCQTHNWFNSSTCPHKRIKELKALEKTK